MTIIKKRDFECPVCKKEKPFFKRIVDKLKKDKRVPDDWNFYLDMKQGVVFPPDRIQMLPIGAKVPGFSFATEICSHCGCVYAVYLEEVDGHTQMKPEISKPKFAPINPNILRGN